MRAHRDPKRRDTSPATLDCGIVKFKIARHFGFCYGVENAIEIAYRALSENPGKRVFLLSEMIHNPEVNADLIGRGAKFLMSTSGQHLIPFESLTAEDVVIVPAFGTTIEIQAELSARGIDPYRYDTTCPFVEKVWKRSSELGRAGHTVIVHGKRSHEETRATFSHSKEGAPTLVVQDMSDTDAVIAFMKGETTEADFVERFHGAYSPNFIPKSDLRSIGVVNQTTMLATETLAIAEKLRTAMIEIYGEANIREHFKDTKDTLCYATYENQGATRSLIESGADVALVIGGYNSSNTSHLVELCQESMPTYYIRDASEIVERSVIRHFSLSKHEVIETKGWLPQAEPVTVALTSGASCPDATVDGVLMRVLSFFVQSEVSVSQALESYLEQAQ